MADTIKFVLLCLIKQKCWFWHLGSCRRIDSTKISSPGVISRGFVLMLPKHFAGSARFDGSKSIVAEIEKCFLAPHRRVRQRRIIIRETWKGVWCTQTDKNVLGEVKSSPASGFSSFAFNGIKSAVAAFCTFQPLVDLHAERTPLVDIFIVMRANELERWVPARALHSTREYISNYILATNFFQTDSGK